MAQGFWTKYFSTLLRGLGALAIKQRIESKKTVRGLIHADKVLYHELIQHVEQDHMVTESLRNDENEVIRDLRVSLNNAYKILFNIEAEDLILLKIVGALIDDLENLAHDAETVAGKLKQGEAAELRKAISGIFKAVYNALRKGEIENREEYQQVMQVIEQVEGNDHNQFMTSLRTMFQNKDTQSYLAKYAVRVEIGRARTDIAQLKQIIMKIRAIRKKLKRDAEKNGVKAVLADIRDEINDIKKYLEDAFYELYQIVKRDIMFILKALYDLNSLKELNDKWVKDNYLPAAQVVDKNERIEVVEHKVSKQLHTIAQGFRIIIHGIHKSEVEAQTEAGKA
tara:strand:- start:375 stop:1391 length:1017 start_codon:yes stop_codon:yes gene_type:complete